MGCDAEKTCVQLRLMKVERLGPLVCQPSGLLRDCGSWFREKPAVRK
jgi:hypothetical protein